MPVMRFIHRNTCLLVTGAALLAMAAASTTTVAVPGVPVAFIELVPLSTASPGDTITSLPAPLAQVDPGASFVVEVWARTDDTQGLSSVSMNIQFDPTIAVVTGVTHTTLFSSLLSGTVDNANGLVVGLSGSHLSSCADQVGVTPTWARVAILDMQAVDSGVLVVNAVDTGLPALGTAICGVGDLLPSQVAYGTATLTVTAPPIPTVSQWGLMILTLLTLTTGTIVYSKRRPRAA